MRLRRSALSAWSGRLPSSGLLPGFGRTWWPGVLPTVWTEGVFQDVDASARIYWRIPMERVGSPPISVGPLSSSLPTLRPI